jgi:glyoxylase-like metal-dependent hydrolase (beta-lactamase superfamily II)
VEQLTVATIVSSDFQENTYVVQLGQRSDCLVIDPGFEPAAILKCLDARHLVPAAILNTHGHVDHIAGNGALKKRWPQVRLVAGKAELEKLVNPTLNLSAALGAPLTSPPADVAVCDGDVFSAAGFDLHVLDVPGHSSGHVAFLWKGQKPAVVFVGDIIMAGSIGRTDFPGGDYDALIRGIRDKLLTLPDDTILYSGHGPETTVGHERRHNPWL